MHKIYVFWATRWVAALSLLREGQNVLSLDVDAVLLGNLYERLRAPPILFQDVRSHTPWVNPIQPGTTHTHIHC